MSVLDTAFAAARAEPDDETRQMAYYAAFAGAEVFVLLDAESDGTTAEPRTVDPGTGPMALAFDREERLAGFLGAPAPYLAVSGRQAAAMLSGAGLGLAFNLDTDFETAFDAETLTWLASVTGETTAQAETPQDLRAPQRLPEDLLEAIDRKLAMAAGYASRAVLVDAGYKGGDRAHLLAVLDCAPEAEEPLAAAIGEAMAFMGFGAGWLDVAFLAADSPLARQMEKVGLVFDLPQPGAPEPKAPGMDPDKPPKLR
ncbi:MAG: SseB family protein [Pseudomonadota bacterium]